MINTERTLLRPIHLKDKEQIFAYRSDAETNKFQSWIPTSLEAVDTFISTNPNTFNLPETWFQLVIIHRKTNRLIGDIGVHFVGKDNHQCEIGCTLNKTYHGFGFATEAVRATIDYLFKVLKKHRIYASVDPENQASIQLLERLNFRKEAHFKESLFLNGQWVDDVIYTVLNQEWKHEND